MGKRFGMRVGSLVMGMVLAAGVSAGAQGNLHNYPLNLDPTVRDGYQHFNNLDFDGAAASFQQVLNAHPQDPMAQNYLLMTLMFRELYHQDLLDTTLYAHEGCLSSKRVGSEDPAVRRRIEDLYGGAASLSE